MINVLTNATRLTMLMLKLMFSSSVTRGVRSIRGIVNNQADTYMMGADRKVLITIPDVTSKKNREKTLKTHLKTLEKWKFVIYNFSLK